MAAATTSATRRSTRSTAANVDRLQVAWTYEAGDHFKGSEMQSNPIVVDGTLYVTTPTLQVVAIDAATGRERWKFDPSGGSGTAHAVPPPRRHGPQRSRVRHLSQLPLGDRSRERPGDRGFGTGGRIDLREGLGKPVERVTVSASTPGAIFEDLLILGSSVPETLPGTPGHIRAFDVATGKLRWIVPHHSAAGRVRLRHVAERRVPAERRRQRVGRRHGRSGQRDGVRRDRLGVVRLLRRQPARRQPVRQLACSRSTRAPASASGTSRGSSTTSGTGIFPRRRTSSPSRATAARSRPWRRSPRTATSSCSIASPVRRSFRSSSGGRVSRTSTANGPRGRNRIR